MVEVDRLMVQEFGVSLLQMMENAGRALASVARDLLGGSATDHRVVVLAGTGGNGGGALAAARRLHGWGAHPVVVTTKDQPAMSPAAGRQLATLRTIGVSVFGAAQLERVPKPDLVLDGILGYGLRSAPRGAAARLLSWARGGDVPVVALDVPSGLDVDSGRPWTSAVAAQATVTLALPKVGLLSSEAASYVGDLYLADIGVPPEVYRRMGIAVGPVFTRSDLVRL